MSHSLFHKLPVLCSSLFPAFLALLLAEAALSRTVPPAQLRALLPQAGGVRAHGGSGLRKTSLPARLCSHPTPGTRTRSVWVSTGLHCSLTGRCCHLRTSPVPLGAKEIVGSFPGKTQETAPAADRQSGIISRGTRYFKLDSALLPKPRAEQSQHRMQDTSKAGSDNQISGSPRWRVSLPPSAWQEGTAPSPAPGGDLVPAPLINPLPVN